MKRFEYASSGLTVNGAKRTHSVLHWLRVCLLTLFAAGASASALAVIGVAQNNYACPADLVDRFSVAFTQAQTAGDLNYVAIGWIGTARVISVTDTKGNTYVPATPTQAGSSDYAQVIFYAKNIVAATAGANQVIVKFDGFVGNLDVRIAEYSGLSTTNVFDGAASASGTGVNTASGSLTTTNANDLLVATNKLETFYTDPGSGFTWQFDTADGDLVEYQIVNATGGYNGTGPQDSSGVWIMQMVAFREAGSPAGGDSTAPSAPSSFTGTLTSGVLNLSWTASTDNVGVTGYVLDRCKGASCSNFSSVGIASGTSYSDTGFVASSSYTYRVRAIDASGNLSSGVTFTATTPAVTFVQSAFADPSDATSLPVTYPVAQTAGDLNVVAVAYSSTTAHVTSVTDTAGNTYTLATGPVVSDVTTQYLYYAKNIGAASSNTITVVFDADVDYPDVRIAEYSGLDTSTPLDQAASASGFGTNTSVGPVTTTTANELIVAATYFYSAGAGAGTGYTQRIFTYPDSDIVEDKIVSSTGSYSATSTQAASDWWVMSMATFRAAPAGDTQAPTTPSSLSANAVSSSEIDLGWTASTDNVGVTGYLVERCQGSGCSTFTQVGTPTTNSFNDTGLSSSTSYTYRVRAQDAVPNLSGYSSTATATTFTGADTQAPTAPTGLSATTISASQINLSWSASTDNVAVTGYRVERCQGSSCSTFTEIATPTGTTFSDTGLTASTSYTYRVRAQDAVPNLSGYSSTATTTTSPPADTQAPTTPTGFIVVAASSNEIDLAWSASTDNVGVTAYVVERCSGPGCSSWSTVATPSVTKFNDVSRSASTSYSYRVSARDAANNTSPPSTTVTYVTPASSPDCN